MNILTLIILILLGLITLVLILALFTKKDYLCQSEITVNAPKQKVFDYLKQLKNQEKFNKWVMVDPDMKKEFKGTDGNLGFIYGWNGNKRAGEGEQEIIKLEEGKMIKTEIRFVRPMKSVAYANLGTEAVSDQQTKISWSNAGKMPYPMNIMASKIEKMLKKDMDTSLLMLKDILEK